MVDIAVIRQKANAMGMSLSQLEEAAGVGNGVIGKWRNASPNIETIQKIANVLKCKIEDLLKKEGE